MVMKLTPGRLFVHVQQNVERLETKFKLNLAELGVNFIKILRACFSYKSAFLPKSFCQNPFAKILSPKLN